MSPGAANCDCTQPSGKLRVVHSKISAFAGEGAGDVVDVAAAAVVVDHPAQGEGVRDQRYVQHHGQIRIGVAAGGHPVGAGHGALGDVHLRLVGDVADDARLGAGAEQGALRAFQHLDTLEVGRIHVEVAARQLPGLVIQVDGDVGEAIDRAAGLGTLITDAQAAHEDVGLPGT